jgi:hypothetical protein
MKEKNEKKEIEIVFTESFRRSYLKLPKVIGRKFDQNDYWEFYIDIKHRCILRKEGNCYFIVAVGGHEVIDRFRFTLR